VVTTITSGTFERQRRQSVNVVEMPFTISTEQLMDEATRTHRVTLKPDASLVDTKKISIAAMLTAEDGSEWSYDVLKSEEDSWQLTLAELEATQQYKINLQIKGETLKGRALFLQPNQIVLLDETKPEMPEIPDLSEEISDELALLEEVAEAEEAKEEKPDGMTPEENLLEEVEELSPLDEIDELDELSPLDEIELTDEFSSDIDELLPVGDDDFGELDNDLTEGDEAPTGEISSSMLMVGNAILLLIVGLDFFMWRRKSVASKNPGEQL